MLSTSVTPNICDLSPARLALSLLTDVIIIIIIIIIIFIIIIITCLQHAWLAPSSSLMLSPES